MKRVIGGLLCVFALFAILGQITAPKAAKAEHKAQDWAFIGVLLAIGIPLSAANPKPKNDEK